MRRIPFAVAAALLASGCLSIVVVHADHGRPHVVIGPGAVTIARGAADAIAVKEISLGLWRTCYSAGLGVSESACFVLDTRKCGIGIIDAGGRPVPARAKALLANLSNEVLAECPHQPKGTIP